MKIFAKTPHEKREVQIEESATIAQVYTFTLLFSF